MTSHHITPDHFTPQGISGNLPSCVGQPSLVSSQRATTLQGLSSMLAPTESTLPRAKAPFHFLPGGSFCMEPRYPIHFPRCGKLRRISSVCCFSNLHRLLAEMPGFYSSKRAPSVVTSLTTVVTPSPSHTSILTWSRANTEGGKHSWEFSSPYNFRGPVGGRDMQNTVKMHAFLLSTWVSSQVKRTLDLSVLPSFMSI